MMARLTLILAALAAAAGLAIGCQATTPMDRLSDTLSRPDQITTTNHPDERCHEDDPCWDCSTMGNRVCGPRP